jgi:hypothetical protein
MSGWLFENDNDVNPSKEEKDLVHKWRIKNSSKNGPYKEKDLNNNVSIGEYQDWKKKKKNEF